jgi:iron complex outermembrane receptor protein
MMRHPMRQKPQKQMRRLSRCALPAFLLAIASGAALAVDLTEADYFSELPEVLTVTRLAQPLSETPGAVTIIDRETIRRSGARELADVLRLVPGYLVGGWSGANPGAAYHAPIDDYGTRNLVLIDGRSIYSSLYLGGTHRGMMGVLLEDIERIEVLRGSNSAAYGANAMFGVINVVTRHTADTHGAEIAVNGGDGGIADNYARIGWGDADASFRLTAGRRKDSGYLDARDDKLVAQLHFRGDLRPAADQELSLFAGAIQHSAGDGFADKVGNPERTTTLHDVYVHGQWRRQLSETDELKLSASYNEEHYRDSSPYAPEPTVVLDFGGRGRRLNLEFHHQVGFSPTLRAAWGAGYKYEDVLSRPLYATDKPVSMHERRLFGNIEWRPHSRWLINAGGFWGWNNWKGAYFSPRLMANFHATPNHAFRIGATKSSRMPTLFELAGDVRYYPTNLAGPFPLNVFAATGLPYRTVAARGGVGMETLYSNEIGYFGNFRDWRLTLDVRAYTERMIGAISTQSYSIANYPIPAVTWWVEDFANSHNFKTHGIEHQVRWKPFDSTEIWLNQNFQRLVWDDDSDEKQPPTHATTLALFQKLPYDLDFGVIFYSTGKMSWRNKERSLPPHHRVDVRLALPFRVGATRLEAAVAVQAATGGYVAAFPYDDHKLRQERRAYGTLRIEF